MCSSFTVRDLQPSLLFGYFADLIAIPRGSGNEAGAREYLLAFSREHGFDSRVDAIGNVVISVPGSRGRESDPPVVLQSHMDIVCEKDSATEFDFLHDPIPAWVDGDLIRTRGTTLGADNGIGMAAALAVATDPDAVHPPLELLFTVDEETGLSGAFNLAADMIRGRTLLNLDSEDEGVLFVGCAGGGDSAVILPVTREPGEGLMSFTVKIGGLQGGHSGLEIAKNRGNALRILGRALLAATDLSTLRIACLSGGNKRNAIPREASACVFVPPEVAEALPAKLSAFSDLIRAELGAADPGVTVTLEADACTCVPADVATSGRIVRLLLGLPHGPLAMSQEIPGLVETSTNLAVASMDDNAVTILCNSRSSIGTAMQAVRDQIRAIGELAGATVSFTGQYPGWRPDMNSRVLAIARKVWAETTGREAGVTAIHAGLECGVIGEKVSGMDMISFGPDIRGVHSPAEHVSVSSTGRFYAFLKALLAAL